MSEDYSDAGFDIFPAEFFSYCSGGFCSRSKEKPMSSLGWMQLGVLWPNRPCKVVDEPTRWVDL